MVHVNFCDEELCARSIAAGYDYCDDHPPVYYNAFDEPIEVRF